MTKTRIYIPALVISLILFAGNAYAINRTLTKGKALSVRSKHCTLNLKKNTLTQIKINCPGKKTNKTTPSSTEKTVYLKPGESVTIKRQKCFLALQSVADKRIGVRCLASEPTPTPTATFTPSATPTETPTPTNTPAVTPDAYALLNSNLVRPFAAATPAFPGGALNISGVTTGDILVSMDRRPQNNMFYALGYNSTAGTVRLYTINPETSTAFPLGDPGAFVDDGGNPVRIGVDASTQIEMDFNPLVDRIRVVTSNGQNFRMNPNNGTFVDGNLNNGTPAGTNMDGPVNGGATSLQGSAYTNNQTNTTVTTLYTLDAATKSLFIQNPPNAGTQSLPSVFNGMAGVAGFDIGSDAVVSANNAAVTSGTGYSFIKTAADAPQLFCAFSLVNVNTNTCGALGPVTSDILGFALDPQLDIPLIALSADGANLIRFKSVSPGTTTTVGVSGVDAGETLVGIDFRPATGELMGLGVNAGADTGTLYRIDPQTAAATAIGAVGSILPGVNLPPSSTSYSFDFNATVDRIRVITGAGSNLNFRINPNTGTVAALDVSINGLSAVIDGASYTNSLNGSTVTTLYTIDSANGSIYIQNSPNGGTQTNAKVINFGSAITFDDLLGFEIQSGAAVTQSNAALDPSAPHHAYLIVTSGGVTREYLLSLTLGEANLIGTFGSTVRSLTAARDQTHRGP